MNIDIPPKLKEYLDESRAPLPPVTDPDEPLHIESLTMIRMVAFLENDLGIRLDDDELIAENFATLRSLAELVLKKRDGSAPADADNRPQ